jgi:hypothetical protein
VTPLEWWTTFGLGAGSDLLIRRVIVWLRAHERDATVPEWERRRAALRRGDWRAQ